MKPLPPFVEKLGPELLSGYTKYRKRRRRAVRVGGAVVVLAALLGVGAVLTSGGDDATVVATGPAAQATAEGSNSPTPSPGPTDDERFAGLPDEVAERLGRCQVASEPLPDLGDGVDAVGPAEVTPGAALRFEWTTAAGTYIETGAGARVQCWTGSVWGDAWLAGRLFGEPLSTFDLNTPITADSYSQRSGLVAIPTETPDATYRVVLYIDECIRKPIDGDVEDPCIQREGEVIFEVVGSSTSAPEADVAERLARCQVAAEPLPDPGDGVDAAGPAELRPGSALNYEWTTAAGNYVETQAAAVVQCWTNDGWDDAWLAASMFDEPLSTFDFGTPIPRELYQEDSGVVAIPAEVPGATYRVLLYIEECTPDPAGGAVEDWCVHLQRHVRLARWTTGQCLAKLAAKASSMVAISSSVITRGGQMPMALPIGRTMTEWSCSRESRAARVSRPRSAAHSAPMPR